MDWKQLLAYIMGSVDRALLLRNEYLIPENRILRQQITGRICLSGGERKTLAELRERLGKQALDEVAAEQFGRLKAILHREGRLIGDIDFMHRWCGSAPSTDRGD
jgi:hypothetical protein